nr:uncharacterized protein LOC113691071 [Coffea arabica]
MEAPLFLQLCDLLLDRGYWEPHPTQWVGIHESVAICLLCLNYNERHRVLAERFQHSSETVDRHLRRCLRSLVRLERDLVRLIDYHIIHPRIQNKALFWPWFKGGRVAHMIPGSYEMFYLILIVPFHDYQQYYAVDTAYTNMSGFMTPFRGARGTHQERAARALFNRCHASLRNIIERTFGVLKKRFPIFKGLMHNYLMATQNNIVLTCCALHNFMCDHVPNDVYFVEEEADGALADNINPFNQMARAQQLDMSTQGIAGWNEYRRAIADHMYYHQHL